MPAAKKKPTQRRTTKAAAKKPRKRRQEIKIPVSEVRELGPLFSNVASRLAQCQHEDPPIYNLLMQIYCTGFASGAVASRKKFTDWNPPPSSDHPREAIVDFVDDFMWTMHALERPHPPAKKDLN